VRENFWAKYSLAFDTDTCMHCSEQAQMVGVCFVDICLFFHCFFFASCFNRFKLAANPAAVTIDDSGEQNETKLVGECMLGKGML
jgi:hypothetical protein